MPRLFLALPLPDEIRAEVARVQAETRARFRHSKIRWVDTSNFHITLHFIGDVDEQGADVLRDRLAAVEGRQCDIRLTELDAFPHRKDPRIIVVKTTLHPHLNVLRRRLADVLVGLNLPFDAETYVPHITLGRVAVRSEVLPLTSVDPLKWKIVDFHLMQSTLTPDGSIFTVLNRYPLLP